MPPVGFEPTISAGERPLTYALDRAATGCDYIIRVNKNRVRQLKTLYYSNLNYSAVAKDIKNFFFAFFKHTA